MQTQEKVFGVNVSVAQLTKVIRIVRGDQVINASVLIKEVVDGRGTVTCSAKVYFSKIIIG